MEKTESPAKSCDTVTIETQIQILLEEYRALYSLLTFRLTAMDRRLPAIGGTLAAILGSTTAMPASMQVAFLFALPSALVGFVLATAQHLRSKEDHVRRIDEIERSINCLAGEELLVFQSCHPNKGRFPGGRTGLVAILAVVIVSLAMLLACAGLIQEATQLLSPTKQAGYSVYLITSAVAILASTIRVGLYRYHRPAPIQHPPCSPSTAKNDP